MAIKVSYTCDGCGTSYEYAYGHMESVRIGVNSTELCKKRCFPLFRKMFDQLLKDQKRD